MHEDIHDTEPYPGRRRRARYRDQMIDRDLDDEDDSRSYRNRKRARAQSARDAPDDDEAPGTVSGGKRGLRIGNTEEVFEYYQTRLKDIQQNACKLIAKAWVRLIEPKKQSNHPYTAGDEKAPDWWPKPWGPTKDDKVRHVEPDHLLKRGTCSV